MARRSQRGFSLLELLIVVFIVLVIAAMATPSLLGTVRRYQLESSARNVVSVLMRARYEAVRLNRRVTTIYVAPGANPPTYGVDEGGPGPPPTTIPDGLLQPSEPQMPLSAAVSLVGVPVPALLIASMGPNYATATFPLGFKISFGAEGTIEQNSGGSWIEANAVSILYLQHNVTQQYAAVTVTPAGRIRVWFWNGAAWTS